MTACLEYSSPPVRSGRGFQSRPAWLSARSPTVPTSASTAFAATARARRGRYGLIAFTDWNGLQIDGRIEDITGIGELNEKWAAFGWDVVVADGHDFRSILDAFSLAHNTDGRPKMILFRTEMGHGVDFMAGDNAWHGKAPSAEQCEAALKQLPETLGDY